MDKKSTLNSILKDFKIDANCIDYADLPNAEIFDITLAKKGKVRDIKRFIDEISFALKVSMANLSVLADKGLLRLEAAKKERPMLKLFNISELYSRSNNLSCLLGSTLSNELLWLDLANAPHLLVAGATGSGKSTIIHTMIANLLMQNALIQIIDPKATEFNAYADYANVKIVSSYQDAVWMLSNLYEEMNGRFNKENQPIVLVIDEFADLVSQDITKQLNTLICQLAQKSRAANIHIVLSTQRPSVNILNGAIKANFPVRIACRVASGVDSRVILDEHGAEKLIGNGDAILKASDGLVRFQAAYSSPSEVQSYYSNQLFLN